MEAVSMVPSSRKGVGAMGITPRVLESRSMAALYASGGRCRCAGQGVDRQVLRLGQPVELGAGEGAEEGLHGGVRFGTHHPAVRRIGTRGLGEPGSEVGL